MASVSIRNDLIAVGLLDSSGRLIPRVGRVFNDGEKPEDRVDAIIGRILRLDKSISDQMYRLKGFKVDVNFDILKAVFVRLRAPADYRTPEEIDGELSLEAAEKKIGIASVAQTIEGVQSLTSREEEVEAIESKKTIQSLIRAADKSDALKGQLAERGFDVDKITKLAIASAEAEARGTSSEKEESIAEPQQRRGALQSFLQAIRTPEIDSLLLDSGFNFGPAATKASAAAQQTLLSATSSAPSAIKLSSTTPPPPAAAGNSLVIGELDPKEVLHMLGFKKRFIPNASQDFIAGFIYSAPSAKP